MSFNIPIEILNLTIYIVAVLMLLTTALLAVKKGWLEKDENDTTYYFRERDNRIKFRARRFWNFVWRKLYTYLLLFIAAIGVLAITQADNWLAMPNISPSQEISGSVLFMTAVVISWYTRETYDLKQINQKQSLETQRQTYLQTQPFIKVFVQEMSSRIPQKVMCVENIGAGHAINLSISVLDKDNKLISKVKIPILESNSEPRSVFDKTYVKNSGDELKIFGDDEKGESRKVEYIKLNYWDITRIEHNLDYAFSTEDIGNFRLYKLDLPEIFKGNIKMHSVHFARTDSEN